VSFENALTARHDGHDDAMTTMPILKESFLKHHRAHRDIVFIVINRRYGL